MSIEDKIVSIVKLEPNATYIITVDDATNEEICEIADAIDTSKFENNKFIIVDKRIAFQLKDD